jgi:hypothetical protein
LGDGDAEYRDDVLDAHLGATPGEVAKVRLDDWVPHLKQVEDVGGSEPLVSQNLGGDVGLEEASEARFQLGFLLLRRACDVVGAGSDSDEFWVGLAHGGVARFERGIEARGLFLLKSVECEDEIA